MTYGLDFYGLTPYGLPAATAVWLVGAFYTTDAGAPADPFGADPTLTIQVY